MDDAGFDRLARSLSETATRRGAVDRVATLWLTVGASLLVPSSATGGLRHRRLVRHRHNHDNRKGQRKGDHGHPPRGGTPAVDCSQPGSDGKPCWLDSQGGVNTRCCNGVCPRDPQCLGVRAWTNVRCDDARGDCRPAERLCCSNTASCDDEEGECFCWFGDPGDVCFFDFDCDYRTPRCVCGMCQ